MPLGLILASGTPIKLNTTENNKDRRKTMFTLSIRFNLAAIRAAGRDNA
ncbi:MAG: hypothetical protein K0B15_11870 [Lentimicrobium sp.]|nr:hypothetical protein [Lentimicrobium sp.]